MKKKMNTMPTVAMMMIWLDYHLMSQSSHQIGGTLFLTSTWMSTVNLLGPIEITIHCNTS